MPEAVKIIVRGRVQGVGFRPFVYRIAAEEKLSGTVQNNMDGVRIIWEGSRDRINRAKLRLMNDRPRLSRIDRVIAEAIPPEGYTTFRIIESDRSGKSELVIPVDSAVCDDCLREMRDPKNFRYRYPFINCTQCGPRYTIIEGLPYDRAYTSMKAFEICADCRQEYEDPLNRRHHAQPIACSACGPELSLIAPDGTVLGNGEKALGRAVDTLEQGGIVAIKGIGGFHLACNAADQEAVARLRQRKGRPDKPLAVMAASVEQAKRIAEVSAEEEKILRSPAAPIVLLRQRQVFSQSVARAVAPGVGTVGIMLPYAPLHHLLFDDGTYQFLVMTSANPSGLPILYQNERAVPYLSGISDCILSHNRPILHAIDDSVVRVGQDLPFFLRRSRGYVPDPMATQMRVDGIAALGSQMKNTFALGRGRQIFISPHLGDLSSVEGMAHYEETFAHLTRWMGITPRLLAIDRHPLFSTREFAEKIGVPMVSVQHHHAHLVSCMEDNELSGKCFGLILDGTGYGDDGATWGFELLHGGAASYRRLAHLRYSPLPGGDKAITEPWRNAAAMLICLLGEEGDLLCKTLFPDRSAAIAIIGRMIRQKVNSPLAGTCGRLFDAVSAILGLCWVSTYDGEAAVLLSETAGDGPDPAQPYPYRISNSTVKELDFTQALRQLTGDHLNGVPVATISRRFHETVVSAACDVTRRVSSEHPEYGKRIVLSGGSFNNPYLSRRIADELRASGFAVFTHHRVPCGDGGLCLGQLAVAAARQE